MTTIQNRTGRLTQDDYTLAGALTQVNSIDLLIENDNGDFLVGLRKNPPARGTYFVPGGRVYKKEKLSNAIIRIMKEELGCELSDIRLFGVFEHYYEGENPSGVPGVDTHYIVHAIKGRLPSDFDTDQFNVQHEDALWLSNEQLLNHERVHSYTKCYFIDQPPNKFTLTPA